MNSERTVEAINDLSAKVVEILERKFKDELVSVCLFGSAARRALRDGSDLDFLVILGDLPKSYHKRGKDVIPLLVDIRETKEYLRVERLDLSLEPSFLLLTTEETRTHPPILIDMSQEGLILFDRNGFLKGHLAEVRDTLARLGSVKKVTPHGSYWVLKPDHKAGEVIRI